MEMLHIEIICLLCCDNDEK